MVQLHSFLAALSMVLSCSAIPLTVPLGSTGKSLTVSDDGQTISVGGQIIDLRRAMNSASACQSLSSKGKAMNSGHPAMASATTAKVVYFITNTAKNSIVALKVSANGTLSNGSITPTGGAGLSGIDSSTGKPAAPDSLFSQGAIKVSGNVRFRSFCVLFIANEEAAPFSRQSRVKYRLLIPHLAALSNNFDHDRSTRLDTRRISNQRHHFQSPVPSMHSQFWCGGRSFLLPNLPHTRSHPTRYSRSTICSGSDNTSIGATQHRIPDFLQQGLNYASNNRQRRPHEE